MKNSNPHFLKKLCAYSGLAGSIIAIPSLAQSQIVYTDVDPDIFIEAENYWVQTQDLDLNNDGITDFQFEIFEDLNYPPYCSTYYSVKVEPYNFNAIANLAGNSVFDIGDTIDNNLTWEQNKTVMAWRWTYWEDCMYNTTSSYGDWLDTDEKFMGLRFNLNGNQHYGWVRLTTDYYFITIHDYAYEATPGIPITAGVCSGLVAYADADGDGFGNIFNHLPAQDCSVPSGYVTDSSDCDDLNASVHPGVCDGSIGNGIDDNCDGAIDNNGDAVTFYADADGDGYGDLNTTTQMCFLPVGYVIDSTDCNDSALSGASVNPGAEEVINCIDDNCNGIIDEGKWIQKAYYGGVARYNAAGFSIGGKAYIGTGKTSTGTYQSDFWEYDPVTNVWTQKAKFGGSKRYKATGFAIGTKGYIGTGYDLNGSLVKTFYEYDIATNAWTKKADFGGTGRQSAAGFSIGAKGYIGTGSSSSGYKNDFWEYDQSTNTWTQKANVGSTLREAAVGFSIGSKGYIGTGSNSSGYKNDFWEYDQSTDTWTQKANFAGTARHSATGFSIDNKGYLGTGYDGSYKNDFWQYDPATNAWKQNIDFTGVVRAYAVGFAVSGKGYMGTGGGAAGSAYSDFWQYETPLTVNTMIYADADGDGFGDANSSTVTMECPVPAGYVTNSSDCNDASASINPAAAPVKQWDFRYGGTSADKLNGLQQTTDGGYILGGASKSSVSGDKSQANWDATNTTLDYWIVKTNASGSKTWDKRFGGTANEGMNSLQQTLDGGYILGGYSYSAINGDKTQPNWDVTGATPDYWVVKTDGSGNLEWNYRFGGTAYDEMVSIQQTLDGGYILGGYSASGISGDKTQASQGGNDYWIVKLNSSGVKQWDKRFGGTGEDYLYTVRQVSGGGYILGGRSQSGAGGDKSQSNWDGSNTTYDYWIVKTDVNGVKQWDKRFGGTGDEFLYSLKQTLDGGYILGGYSSSGVSGDKTQASQGSNDYWIVKITADGTKQWDMRYGGSADDQLFSLLQTPEGGYLLGGYSASGISGDKTQTSQGLKDYWIVKTDDTGVKQWDARYGGTKNDFLAVLQQTSDAGYILGGYSFSGITGDKTQANWDATNATQDYWMVKLSVTNGFQAFYPDADNDGYGNPFTIRFGCSAPPGYVSNGNDCNDASATINPGASDICNSIDDNCSGVVDENAITATITPAGTVTSCSGALITLTANTGAGITYQWIKGGITDGSLIAEKLINIAGATNSIYTTSEAGSYKVKESNSFGCSSTSASTTVSVASNPDATITPLGNLDICVTGSVDLQANGGTGLIYQWKKGGNNVAGATNQIYTATKAATYKVVVTNSNGCSKTSAGTTVTKSCKDGLSKNKISAGELFVYPNPTTGNISVEYAGSQGVVLFTVYDVMGKVVFTQEEKTSEGAIDTYQFHLTELTPGTYVLEARNGVDVRHAQFVIER